MYVCMNIYIYYINTYIYMCLLIYGNLVSVSTRMVTFVCDI